MERKTVALSSVIVALVVLAPIVGLAPVGTATAAVENVEQRPDSYVVEQGEECIQVEPIGDATTNVSAYYDYREGPDGEWSSHGTTDRQQSQLSQLYVYRGSEGDSLVFLHDAVNDDEQAGAISMEISGLPDARSWAVEDDGYEGRDDRFQHDGSESQIDWMWSPGRTDGAAVRGVAETGYDEITIDPAFSEDSYAASEGWPYADDPLDWRVETGNGTLVSLDQDENVTVRHGVCQGTSPPEADLTAAPTTPDAGENVTLDASGSSDEDGIVTYRWDVDGDGQFDAETAQPTFVHAYNEAGQVQPTVEVVDGTDETDTASTTIDVQEAASVTAVADLPETVQAGETVTLDGSNSTGSVEIDSYEWTIEDGPQLTGETVQHQFDEGGTYDVTLTVTGDGATDETTTSIEVIDDEPPTADITAPASAEAGETVTLDASGSADDRGIAEYRWDVDGSGSTDETTTSPQLDVAYPEAGEYTPTVAVVDSRNQVADASTTIEITRPEEFSVALDANRTTVMPGEGIAFDATATPQDVADSYTYNFGNGETASGPNAVHAFASPGEYTVGVEAESSDGRTASDTVVVTVEADEPPEAALDASAKAEVGEKVWLDARDSWDDRGIVEYEWDLDGDGTFEKTTEKAKYPVSYSKVGKQTPTVRVRDERGHVDEASATITVSYAEEFTVEADANRTTFTTGDPIKFEAVASPEDVVKGYEFALGDGTTAAERCVVHSYDEPGEYTVTVQAWSEDGRSASDKLTITVEESSADPPEDSPEDTPTDSPDDSKDDSNESAEKDESDDSGGSGGGGGGGVSLEPPGTPSISISDVTVSDATVHPGELVEVGTTLTNEGDGDGTKEVNLTVDGDVVDSVDVFVGANESRTVHLEHRAQRTGSYDLSVGEIDGGTLDVQSKATSQSSADGDAIHLVELSAPTESVAVETPVDVDATFENTANRDRTFDARLLVDGETEAVEDVSIPAGETATVTFEKSFATSGTYEVTVNGTERTVVVGEGDDENRQVGSDAGGFPLGIYAVVGVGALVAVVAAIGRWL